MQVFRYALVQGLSRALRHWRVLLPLYLLGLVFGLVQTWPLLFGGALYTPYVRELITGESDALVNLFLGSSAAGGVAAAWVFVALLLALLYGLAYSFFAGGVLSAYSGRGAFWAGCRRTFWPFVALGMLLLMLFGFAVAVAALLSVLLGSSGALIVALVLIQLINVLGEYARAVGVVGDRRNPFALLGVAAGFCARHLGGVLALALIGLLLHAALAMLYSLVADAVGGSPIRIICQQFVVLAWLWVKLLRLSWAASYVQVNLEDGAATAANGALASASIN